jgi:hypothetical protein
VVPCWAILNACSARRTVRTVVQNILYDTSYVYELSTGTYCVRYRYDVSCNSNSFTRSDHKYDKNTMEHDATLDE